MTKALHQFAASELGSGAVAKDGRAFMLEFETEDERLWVTLPAAALERLVTIATELHAISIDAKNGVALQWHVTGGKPPPCPPDDSP